MVKVLLARTKCPSKLSTTLVRRSPEATKTSLNLVGKVGANLTSLLGEDLVTQNLFVA